MDRAEYQSLKKINPWLWKEIAPYKAELATVELIHPSKAIKYTNLCNKLQLQRNPDLVIVENYIAKGQHATNNNVNGDSAPKVRGYYSPLGLCVVVTRDTYNDFLKDGALGVYCVAHELGHAKSDQNMRRAFLKAGEPINGCLICWNGR